ncbi:hypothetical protein TIFTF001_014954 [Ficus carica]|uniref:Uncharacterized protein n=1 Tax=Ficus carica TaxID=3494 RepID=A0AA88D635_FICCA|nr:hypothetical protein TIFTF001_014954 [Ficus carica]
MWKKHTAAAAKKKLRHSNNRGGHAGRGRRQGRDGCNRLQFVMDNHAICCNRIPWSPRRNTRQSARDIDRRASERPRVGSGEITLSLSLSLSSVPSILHPTDTDELPHIHHCRM